MSLITEDSEFENEREVQLTNEIPVYNMFEGLNSTLQNDMWEWFLGNQKVEYDVDPLYAHKTINGSISPYYNRFKDKARNKITRNVELTGALTPEIDLFLHEIYRYLETLYPNHPDWRYLLTRNELVDQFNQSAAMVDYEPDFNFFDKLSKSYSNYSILTDEEIDKVDKEFFKICYHNITNNALRRKYAGTNIGYRMLGNDIYSMISVFPVAECLTLKEVDDKNYNINDLHEDAIDKNYKNKFKLIDWESSYDDFEKINDSILETKVRTYPGYRNILFEDNDKPYSEIKDIDANLIAKINNKEYNIASYNSEVHKGNSLVTLWNTSENIEVEPLQVKYDTVENIINLINQHCQNNVDLTQNTTIENWLTKAIENLSNVNIDLFQNKKQIYISPLKYGTASATPKEFLDYYTGNKQENNNHTLFTINDNDYYQITSKNNGQIELACNSDFNVNQGDYYLRITSDNNEVFVVKGKLNENKIFTINNISKFLTFDKDNDASNIEFYIVHNEYLSLKQEAERLIESFNTVGGLTKNDSARLLELTGQEIISLNSLEKNKKGILDYLEESLENSSKILDSDNNLLFGINSKVEIYTSQDNVPQLLSAATIKNIELLSYSFCLLFSDGKLQTDNIEAITNNENIYVYCYAQNGFINGLKNDIGLISCSIKEKSGITKQIIGHVSIANDIKNEIEIDTASQDIIPYLNIGDKIFGGGLPGNTFITSIGKGSITVSNNFVKDISDYFYIICTNDAISQDISYDSEYIQDQVNLGYLKNSIFDDLSNISQQYLTGFADIGFYKVNEYSSDIASLQNDMTDSVYVLPVVKLTKELFIEINCNRIIYDNENEYLMRVEWLDYMTNELKQMGSLENKNSIGAQLLLHAKNKVRLSENEYSDENIKTKFIANISDDQVPVKAVVGTGNFFGTVQDNFNSNNEKLTYIDKPLFSKTLNEYEVEYLKNKKYLATQANFSKKKYSDMEIADNVNILNESFFSNNVLKTWPNKAEKNYYEYTDFKCLGTIDALDIISYNENGYTTKIKYPEGPKTDETNVVYYYIFKDKQSLSLLGLYDEFDNFNINGNIGTKIENVNSSIGNGIITIDFTECELGDTLRIVNNGKEYLTVIKEKTETNIYAKFDCDYLDIDENTEYYIVNKVNHNSAENIIPKYSLLVWEANYKANKEYETYYEESVVGDSIWMKEIPTKYFGRWRVMRFENIGIWPNSDDLTSDYNVNLQNKNILLEDGSTIGNYVQNFCYTLPSSVQSCLLTKLVSVLGKDNIFNQNNYFNLTSEDFLQGTFILPNNAKEYYLSNFDINKIYLFNYTSGLNLKGINENNLSDGDLIFLYFNKKQYLENYPKDETHADTKCVKIKEGNTIMLGSREDITQNGVPITFERYDCNQSVYTVNIGYISKKNNFYYQIPYYFSENISLDERNLIINENNICSPFHWKNNYYTNIQLPTENIVKEDNSFVIEIDPQLISEGYLVENDEYVLDENGEKIKEYYDVSNGFITKSEALDCFLITTYQAFKNGSTYTVDISKTKTWTLKFNENKYFKNLLTINCNYQKLNIYDKGEIRETGIISKQNGEVFPIEQLNENSIIVNVKEGKTRSVYKSGYESLIRVSSENVTVKPYGKKDTGEQIFTADKETQNSTTNDLLLDSTINNFLPTRAELENVYRNDVVVENEDAEETQEGSEIITAEDKIFNVIMQPRVYDINVESVREITQNSTNSAADYFRNNLVFEGIVKADSLNKIFIGEDNLVYNDLQDYINSGMTLTDMYNISGMSLTKIKTYIDSELVDPKNISEITSSEDFIFAIINDELHYGQIVFNSEIEEIRLVMSKLYLDNLTIKKIKEKNNSIWNVVLSDDTSAIVTIKALIENDNKTCSCEYFDTQNIQTQNTSGFISYNNYTFTPTWQVQNEYDERIDDYYNSRINDASLTKQFSISHSNNGIENLTGEICKQQNSDIINLYRKGCYYINNNVHGCFIYDKTLQIFGPKLALDNSSNEVITEESYWSDIWNLSDITYVRTYENASYVTEEHLFNDNDIIYKVTLTNSSFIFSFTNGKTAIIDYENCTCWKDFSDTRNWKFITFGVQEEYYDAEAPDEVSNLSYETDSNQVTLLFDNPADSDLTSIELSIENVEDGEENGD